MKKIHLSLMLLAVVSGLTTSCSDFLDREPLTQPTNFTFLSGEEQVRNYINGLYIALPSLQQFGMGVRGEEKKSDNILSEHSSRRMNGEYSKNEAVASSIWQQGYQNLRNVNYFFAYYLIPASEENENIRSLKGEAYFLRAYWHYYLLRNFGCIPVMDAFWDEHATIEGLQIPQRDRGEVADFILRDLTEAEQLLYPRSRYKGLRISKEAAVMLAMDVALYEGTWEKYHAADDFAAATNRSEYFLAEVLRWGDQLLGKDIQLNTVDNDPFGCKNPGDAYAHLFNQKDFSNVSEAVFWRKYSAAEGVFHLLPSLLGAGTVDENAPAGVAKELVDTYLNLDGTFVNPTDEKFKDFNQMFEGRDWRLGETIMHTGKQFKSSKKGNKPMKVARYDNNDKTINPPFLVGDGNQRNITGFHIALGSDTTFVEGNGETGLIMFRYATALLDYAEAAAELGRCNDEVLAKTLKPLRERAGVKYVKPSQLDAHFTTYGVTDPVIQEIRRERRVELALQGYRLDDLMRWKATEKVMANKRGRGAYLGEDGILYQSFSAEKAEDISLLAKDEKGFLDPLKQFIPSGYQFKANRDYLLPKSPDELELNKQLKQNPGWE